MKIGSLEIKNPYFLAPMEEVNDPAFRVLCKEAGAGLVYTGMINPLSKQKMNLEDHPALQLFCNSEEGISKFIKKYDSKVSLWDFNLGCPAKLAEKCKVGSYLTDLKSIEKILKIMRKSTKKPVTIKIRKSDYAKELAELAELYCDAITIHPRTRQQGYSGKPDIGFAKKIKSLVKIPVIYSGDVNENNAQDLLKFFDAVMIGRKTMGNPNIFAKLTKNPKQYKFSDYLVLAEKYDIKFNLVKKQAVYFTKEKKYAKSIRENITKAKTVEELKGLI